MGWNSSQLLGETEQSLMVLGIPAARPLGRITIASGRAEIAEMPARGRYTTDRSRSTIGFTVTGMSRDLSSIYPDTQISTSSLSLGSIYCRSIRPKFCPHANPWSAGTFSNTLLLSSPDWTLGGSEFLHLASLEAARDKCQRHNATYVHIWSVDVHI